MSDTIKKIEMRSSGTNNLYNEVLYPKTSSDMVEIKDIGNGLEFRLGMQNGILFLEEK